MQKYFKEEKKEKFSLKYYWEQIELAYQKLESEGKKTKLSHKHVQIKHIYSSLGDVMISEKQLETICETFNSSRCRYGTICLKGETIRDIYKITELFPELSKEAILWISKEYIKDLFDKYSLIENLAIMLREYGMKDSTFEKFMNEVDILAYKEEKIYSEVASYIRMYCGQYSYDFVRHFERFVKEHHISWQRFRECLPSPELILKDQVELLALARRAKDCFGICDPITFQMLEDYLDGDTELKDYCEQPYYFISTQTGKVDTSFTKTQFIESIEQEQLKKVRKPSY